MWFGGFGGFTVVGVLCVWFPGLGWFVLVLRLLDAWCRFAGWHYCGFGLGIAAGLVCCGCLQVGARTWVFH